MRRAKKFISKNLKNLGLDLLDDDTTRCINDLTCKRGSVGQSEGLSIPRSSVRFRLKPDTSNSFIDPPTRVLNYF